MLINELHDDCLLDIFDYIKELDNLINCYFVCLKWRNLILDQTRKVKYLLGDSSHNPDTFTYQRDEPIDFTCLNEIYPNLKIVDLAILFARRANHEDIVKILNGSKLKGIIDRNGYYNQFMSECSNLEMVSTYYIESDICIVGHKNAAKQLHLRSSTLDQFKEVAHLFPYLERLHIQNNEDRPDKLSRWHIMTNLKILELSLSSYDGLDTCISFAFMDSCPVLQSAHIQVNSTEIYIDNSIKHENLQDLVIQFYGWDSSIPQDNLRRLMSKYPNLKHLALRRTTLKNEQIKELLLILPKLSLLDVRLSGGVTQKADYYIQNHCKQQGKSIKFYFDEAEKQIKSDWPQLSTKQTKVHQGFDFMKHCFFMEDFFYLPNLLDPMDD